MRYAIDRFEFDVCDYAPANLAWEYSLASEFYEIY